MSITREWNSNNSDKCCDERTNESDKNCYEIWQGQIPIHHSIQSGPPFAFQRLRISCKSCGASLKQIVCPRIGCFGCHCRFAEEDGVSLNQWVSVAVAHQIGAVETAEAFFKRRSQGAEEIDSLKILLNSPDRIPDPGDQLR
jgi:hypothetical protein